MLKKFSFRNCYSFKGDTSFSMEANYAMKDNIGFVVTKGSGQNAVHLNPVAAIYGANAGGKTNILRALSDAIQNIYVGLWFRNSSFLLTEKRDVPFEHGLCVLIGDTEYDYRYEIGSGVYKESLITRELSEGGAVKEIFTRERGTVKSATFAAGTNERTVIDAAARNVGVLVLKSAGEMGLEPFANLYRWCAGVNAVLDVTGVKDRVSKLNEFALEIAGNKGVQEDASKFISAFDVSIGNIGAFEDRSAKNEESFSEQKFRLAIGHKARDGGDLYFRPEMESNGTNKILELYPRLRDALRGGYPVIFDEFDASLHPLAFRKIIETFNDPEQNPNGAQLIFTAHNTIIMNREYLRRDEVYFADKSEFGESSLCRLSEITDEDGNKIRMDARYDRLYLDRLFGAATPDVFDFARFQGGTA